MLDLAVLALPVVAAPMAGGPSTPALAAAVTEAGGLGFLAAGYTTPAQVADAIAATRALTAGAIGVNLFVPAEPPAPDAAHAVEVYRDLLLREALTHGIDLPQPRWDDTDDYRDKLTLLADITPVEVVSFTFGCPTSADVDRLHRAGTLVLVTVTDPGEARAARDAGADALVVQGFEAGGHRGTHTVAREPNHQDHLALLPQCADAGLPMVAAGGIVTPGDTRRALDAGAVAIQAGTAFLLTPEAGTSPTYRRALREPWPSVITRAFSGRCARGLRNGFAAEYTEAAPAVFPQVDQLTKPLRRAAAERGDVDGISVWAGSGWRAIAEAPAAEITRSLGVC